MLRRRIRLGTQRNSRMLPSHRLPRLRLAVCVLVHHHLRERWLRDPSHQRLGLLRFRHHHRHLEVAGSIMKSCFLFIFLPFLNLFDSRVCFSRPGLLIPHFFFYRPFLKTSNLIFFSPLFHQRLADCDFFPIMLLKFFHLVVVFVPFTDIPSPLHGAIR